MSRISLQMRENLICQLFGRDNLRLNDVIMAQLQASAIPSGEAYLTAWEREIMGRLLHPEVRMGKRTK